MNILLSCFNMTLPFNFHKKVAVPEPTPGKENSPNKKTGKGKRKGNGKEDEGGCKRDNTLVNSDQFPEFKMKDNKTWEKTFQGKCADKRVKFLGTYICPCFHTRGYCWKEGCKFSKTRLPASKIPEEQRREYKQYMACCRATPSLNE